MSAEEVRGDIWATDLLGHLGPYFKAAGDYAGAYITRDERQVYLHIGFTGDLEAHRAALRERGLDQDGLLLFSARFTLAELMEIVEQVSARIEPLRTEGIELTSIGPDSVQGVVRIGVLNLTEDIRNRLRSEFGETVQVYKGTLNIAT